MIARIIPAIIMLASAASSWAWYSHCRRRAASADTARTPRNALQIARRVCTIALLASVLLASTGCLATLRRARDLYRDYRDIDTEQPADNAGVFDGVIWLHADVSGWEQTATIESVTVAGGLIRFPYDKASSWPVLRQRATDGGPLVGNVWAIIPHAGQRYAVAWDWVRLGQKSKAIRSFRGSDGHMPAPLNNFQPVSGEQYGFFVSTAARGAERSGNKRSNVITITWP